MQKGQKWKKMLLDEGIEESQLPESFVCPVCGRVLKAWSDVMCGIVWHTEFFCEAGHQSSQKYWNEYRKGNIHTKENRVAIEYKRKVKRNPLNGRTSVGVWVRVQ